MKVGSLFTGAGGLDMAVAALWPDSTLSWFSEVNRHAAATFAHHHPDVPNLGDVEAVDWTQVEPVDVMVGGFPCQDISYAGLGAGIEEGTRSGLWYRFADAIGTLRPRLVLLENVAAIVVRGGTAVVGTLADLGYDVAWTTLRASDVGCCHQRARWFAVAYPHDQGLEGWHHAGVRERGRQRPVGQGDPPVGVMLPTPRSSDGPHGGPNQTGDGLQPAVRHLPTPKATNNENRQTGTFGPNLGEATRSKNGARWDDYAAAIARWETIHGPVPAPTNDEGRLSPPFVEWMMGWLEGWTLGPRTQRLKQCGNGVVPHQAVSAYSFLLDQVAAGVAA